MKVLCVKIPQKYNELKNANLEYDEVALYNATRGNWVVSLENVEDVFYVFAVVQDKIIAAYEPYKWDKCCEKTDLMPGKYKEEDHKHRAFFVGDPKPVEIPTKIKNVVQKLVEENKGNQNPVFYLNI